MIVLTFKTKKDKEHMLEKAKKMGAYIDELIDCLEEAVSDSYDDEYQERTYYRDARREPHEEYRRMSRKGRYDY